MTYEQIALTRNGPVARVTMNRPERLNALTMVMWDELVDAFRLVAADDGVRCVVLTGAGRGFCAGRDQDEAAAMVDDQPLTKERLLEMHHSLIPTMVQAPKPIIACVNGPAAGAGLSLALACDLRIASAEARFTVAFLKRGLTPDAGLSYLIQRAVGFSKALELCLTSEVIDAAEALRIGLVDRVVDAATLVDHVEATAGEFASLSALVVKATKAILREAPSAGLAGTLDSEADWQSQIVLDEAYREGMRSFFEERAARQESRDR